MVVSYKTWVKVGKKEKPRKLFSRKMHKSQKVGKKEANLKGP